MCDKWQARIIRWTKLRLLCWRRRTDEKIPQSPAKLLIYYFFVVCRASGWWCDQIVMMVMILIVMMWCGVIWYDMIWCDIMVVVVEWCDMICCVMIFIMYYIMMMWYTDALHATCVDVVLVRCCVIGVVIIFIRSHVLYKILSYNLPVLCS